MSHRFMQWTYLFAICVVAIFFGYAINRLQHNDHVSCENRKALIGGEHLLLNIIYQSVNKFDTSKLTPAQKTQLDKLKVQLKAARDVLEATPTCTTLAHAEQAVLIP